eukprot:scaffold49099_cov14-Tisochrysis_lutea.AAC.1
MSGNISKHLNQGKREQVQRDALCCSKGLQSSRAESSLTRSIFSSKKRYFRHTHIRTQACKQASMRLDTP